MNRSAPDAPPWPLEDGERVLWEGAPDAAALRRAFPIRPALTAFAVFLLLSAVAILVNAFPFKTHGPGATVVLDEGLNLVEVPPGPGDGSFLARLFAMAALVAGFTLVPVLVFRVARPAAVTDRRVLLRGPLSVRAVPAENIGDIRSDPRSDGTRGLVLLAPAPRNGTRVRRLASIGPLAPDAADAAESALAGLGLFRAPDAPGERILWTGRPAPRFPWTETLLAWGAAAAFAVWPVAELVRGSDLAVRDAVRVCGFVGAAFLRACGRLLSGEFGARGVAIGLSATCLLLVVALCFVCAILLPASARRKARRARYVVTSHRVRSDPAGGPGRRFDLLPPELFPPVAKPRRWGRSDVFFAASSPGGRVAPGRESRFRCAGFLDLPAADVPAALAALEELRNSAAPRTAFRP